MDTGNNTEKIILIAGASGGIGEAAAKAFSDEGIRLVLTGRRLERLENIRTGLTDPDKVYVFPCDVNNIVDIEKLFGFICDNQIKLSGMVYCAGLWCMKTCKAMSMDDLESMFRTNVFGFYEMCRHFVSPKISEKGSSILGMSSIACLKRESGTSAYSMTKAAVNAMVYSLSAEFMKRQIRINALLPGIVRSKMGEDIDDRTDEEFERIAATQPLGAIPVEEIADMIVYMMSDRSAHMTGELITMSGGYR